MPLIIKPSQAEQVRKLVSRCCNWDEGICLLLEMPCPQQLSLTRINCRYFREAVLPANQRLYIRLPNLIPEILTMVDEGKIALTPAVELSYLTEQEQRNLLETMESEDCTPSLSQAIRLKKLSQEGALDTEKTLEILREPKANQQEKISFRVEEIRKFFPKSYSAAKIQETILKLLVDFQKKRSRDHSL